MGELAQAANRPQHDEELHEQHRARRAGDADDFAMRPVEFLDLDRHDVLASSSDPGRVLINSVMRTP
jgi:hypothetical protein